MPLTQEQKSEFRELKHKRVEQGFFTPTQEVRYFQLWDINAKRFKVGMNVLFMEQN